MSEVVGFSVEGEFITDLSRSWLWDEHKPYSKVEELLLACLVTDQLTESERKSIVVDILEGRKKLVGINSFTLEEDGKQVRSLVDLFRTVGDEAERLREDNEYLQDSIYELNTTLDDAVKEGERAKRQASIDKIRDAMKTSNMLFPMDIELRGIVSEDMVIFCEEFDLEPAWRSWAGNRWIMFYKKGEDYPCSTEYLREIGALKEVDKTPVQEPTEDIIEYNPWGWLSPTGEFTEGDFGEHEQVAYDIIRKKGWDEEFDSWERGTVRLGRDFLAEVKGYVLLHNPTGQSYTIVSHEKPLTKAQKEFLYDYFMKEGDTIRANSFFDD